MVSSSSSSSSFDVVSRPRENDVLWMQNQHVSQHIWNGDTNRKLRMRRAISTYQGIEQPPQKIIPLLQQYRLYTTIKLCRIKINGEIVNAFVERWRPETHTFHLTCGEATITLQDVFVLLGLLVDDNPLIGSTNIDGIDMCEQCLGVRTNANALADENTLKLSWLASEFANIHDYVDDKEHLKMFARAWILRFIEGVLLVDKSSKIVPMRYLQFLVDFEECSSYARGVAALSYLYKEMCNTTDYNVQSIGGYVLLIQLWACNYCSQLNEWNSLYERWFQETPPQVGPLNVNYEYMKWFRHKTKLYISRQHARRGLMGEIIEIMQFMLLPYGRSVSTLDDLALCLDKMTLLAEEDDRIIEAREEAPPSVPQFEGQEFDMLGRSVEPQGLGRHRESVDAEAHVIPAMPERQHGMYYTLDQFTQVSSQMSPLYPYPYQSGTS
ncbi:Serine/threonine-protein phosphatase 7 long form [Glycine max]|nr:Serine/threonine-protein phosphatase 7 long form [Glycine max]